VIGSTESPLIKSIRSILLVLGSARTRLVLVLGSLIGGTVLGTSPFWMQHIAILQIRQHHGHVVTEPRGFEWLRSKTPENWWLGFDEVTDVGSTTDFDHRGLAWTAWLRSCRYARFDNITSQGLKSICQLKTLEQVSLSDSRIDEESFAFLATLPHLEKLTICHCSIKDDGLNHLSGMKPLRRLLLHNSDVVDESMDLLASCTQIEELSLFHTAVTDAGIKKLKTMSGLRSINLMWVPFSDEGLNSLAEMPSLEHFDF
jgi:hypothetical protein